MRLTTRTNLATRVLMYCAVNLGKVVRAADIAEATNASGNHLAQVIHQLQQQGFVKTLRGRSGGLQLARAADQISIGAVFRALESQVPLTECFSASDNTCPLTDDCRLRDYLATAIAAFYHQMDMVTLEDLVRGNCGLAALLEQKPEPIPCISKNQRPAARAVA